MRRGTALLLLFLTGCSTAPIADLLDYFSPGTVGPGKGQPYGGVCTPRPLLPTPPTPPGLPPPPPPGPDVPPPPPVAGPALPPVPPPPF